jgi:hypothetical protein
MAAERYASIVDVHVILRGGTQILLLRRADTVDYTAAVITAVESGTKFTLNGW